MMMEKGQEEESKMREISETFSQATVTPSREMMMMMMMMMMILMGLCAPL